MFKCDYCYYFITKPSKANNFLAKVKKILEEENAKGVDNEKDISS